VLLFHCFPFAGERTWPRSAAPLAAGEKKTPQDAPGHVVEGLADAQHPLRVDRSEKTGRFVFFE